MDELARCESAYPLNSARRDMASHFSSIGFDIGSTEEIVELANQLLPSSSSLKVRGGRSFRWTGGAGQELWFSVDRSGTLVEVAPHFKGTASMRVGLTSLISRPEDAPFGGAFHAWASPENADVESGCYPFVFDSPNIFVHRKLELPCIAEAQVAAFAHSVEAFASREAYDNSQEGKEGRFASQSFVPSGLFDQEGESSGPESTALLTGHILEAERLTNEHSGTDFYRALVETYGGQMDVVIDPSLLTEPPVAGGVLQGTFWLSGVLDIREQRKRGFLRRLFS